MISRTTSSTKGKDVSEVIKSKEKVSIAAKLVFILVGLAFLTPIAFKQVDVSDTVTLFVLGIYAAFGVSFDIMNFKHTKLISEESKSAPEPQAEVK